MKFSDLILEKEKLIATFSSEQGMPLNEIRAIASPYRVSPLGAHIDHQGGPVLGMTINAYSLLVYVPGDNEQVTLRSENYPGQLKFNLQQIPANTDKFWGSYARAAALALNEDWPLTRGINGLISGMLPGCGLSSSASVLLAYLYALAEVNGLRLQPWDFVQLTRRAENKYIGLNNGILNQTSIVFGKRHHLLHIDTIAASVKAFEDKMQEKTHRILIAYSGFSRELMATGYNTRVKECREAAAELARLDGSPPAVQLADVSEQTFQQHGYRLAAHLQRRAAHFYSEVGRVQRGLEYWQQGRLIEFGRLMVESCQSSIERYECGSPAIHDLQQIVSSADGVIGSRFGGGGFGGCVVGLVRTDHAVDAARQIRQAYFKSHPETAGQAAVYLARSADGIRFL